MGIIDFILNLAGLLLWLNWRSDRFDPLTKRMPATLMGTLRPAAPRKLRRWHLLGFIAALLLLRAWIYWWIGKETNWAGKLNLGVVVLWFSSGLHWIAFCRIVLFSFASFGLMVGIFYVWVLALSVLSGPLPVHGLVTIPLGRVDGWPRWAKAILPFLGTAIIWWLASWLLIRWEILTAMPPAGRFQQSLVLGVNAYLLWQYPLGAILVLHLLNSYIYFGKHPFWKYIDATAHTILQPIRRIPLQIGKVDMAPLLGIVLIFGVAHVAENGLPWLHIPGLVSIYGRLPL
jgi:uncharacterized protein YggT (Ycf19 family)